MARLLAFTLVLTMVGIVISATPSKADRQIDRSVAAEIALTSGTTVEQAITRSARAQLRVVKLESSFLIGSTRITDFYLPSSDDSAGSISLSFAQSRKDFLHNLVHRAGNESLAKDALAIEYLNEQNLRTAASNLNNIHISSITVIGGSDDIARLASDNIVTDVTFQAQREDSIQSVTATTLHQSEAVLSQSQWYPEFGVSFIGECLPNELAPCQNGKRYSLQLMRWGSNNFADNQTYEHEFLLYNYDGKTYLDNDSSLQNGCFPEATYAATSWPAEAKPYVDTRLSDWLVYCNTDELEFTMGAARAKQIPADVMQFTYIQTEKGNVDQGKFKLQGQIGYHLVKDCDNLWCVNQYVNIPVERLIPAWSNLAPGRQEWSAPKTNRSIGGIIREYSTGNPIADATITIEKAGEVFTTTSDPVGYYVFTDVPEGKYKIVAKKDGIGEGTDETTISGNDDALINLALVKARSQDIAIIIDSSGSMADNDPNNLRVQAASFFLEALDPNSRVTVIDFDSSSRVVWPLKVMGSDQQAIINAIRRSIDSSGGTNISAGIRTAFEQLNDNSLQPKVAILLTDGRQDGSRYDPQWQEAFAAKEWPIYTFGLSSAADEELLNNIATMTDGQYTFLASANQLGGFYNTLRSKLSGSQQILDRGIVMKTGDAQSISVGIFQSTTRVANFAVSWPGSRVDTVLHDPDGRIITSSTQDPNITHRKGDTYEIYTVRYPKTGVWEMRADGIDLATSGELVTFQVDTASLIQRMYLPLLRSAGERPRLANPPLPPITPVSTVIPLPEPSETPSPTVSPTSSPTPTPTTIPSTGTTLRIDTAASTSYTDAAGNVWSADTGFFDGNVVDRGNIAIANTNDPRLYQTERWGMTGYVLPVQNGTYTVKLHFAETNSSIDQVGERVFGVSVEGTNLGNVDIVAQAGGQYIALVKAVNVVVTDGQLNIGFTRITQAPEINAIEVIPTRQAALRIEAGNAASYLDTSGNTWVADTGFVGGNVVDRGNVSIGNTNDPRLYQTERWSMSEYVLPLTNGSYTVRLHFAETNPAHVRAGMRIFGVTVEGTSLGPLDVFAETGGQRIALIKTVSVNVTDGQLNINFIPQVENPMIKAIEVIPNS